MSNFGSGHQAQQQNKYKFSQKSLKNNFLGLYNSRLTEESPEQFAVPYKKKCSLNFLLSKSAISQSFNFKVREIYVDKYV